MAAIPHGCLIRNVGDSSGTPLYPGLSAFLLQVQARTMNHLRAIQMVYPSLRGSLRMARTMIREEGASRVVTVIFEIHNFADPKFADTRMRLIPDWWRVSTMAG